MFKPILIAALCTTPLPLAAQSMASMQKAQDLGTLLAAEDFCGLTYDQDAVGRWIDENTDPADMGFSGTLTMMTEGSAFMLGDMSASGKTAHCRSIERTARHYGFIK